jgi:hypothetical protein
MKLRLLNKNKADLQLAQATVEQHHYLHRRVDTRCSPVGYAIILGDSPVGILLFGRPQSTSCYPFFGSVEDVQTGRAEVTRWQILNLARVWIHPTAQKGGGLYGPEWGLPGFVDRRGVWRSTLASAAINAAFDRIVIDYLVEKPPCFPEEPYELRYAISYCDTRIHKGALYRAAGFELYRTNKDGVQTWRKELRPLTGSENEQVLEASRISKRSQGYRAKRRQLELELQPQA